MIGRLPWFLAVILGVGCLLSTRALLATAPAFATLPIFVPVSLEYERKLRAERSQPAVRGGEEAVAVARALLAEGSGEGEPDPALAVRVAALHVRREALLDARGRRHALNIALMDVGVAIAAELTPAQWDRIHMRRDELRARTEAEVFSRLLEKLR